MLEPFGVNRIARPDPVVIGGMTDEARHDYIVVHGPRRRCLRSVEKGSSIRGAVT